MNRILMTLILAVLLPTASPGQTPPPPGDPYLCYKAALAKTVPPQAKFSLVLGLPPDRSRCCSPTPSSQGT